MSTNPHNSNLSNFFKKIIEKNNKKDVFKNKIDYNFIDNIVEPKKQKNLDDFIIIEKKFSSKRINFNQNNKLNNNKQNFNKNYIIDLTKEEKIEKNENEYLKKKKKREFEIDDEKFRNIFDKKYQKEKNSYFYEKEESKKIDNFIIEKKNQKEKEKIQKNINFAKEILRNQIQINNNNNNNENNEKNNKQLNNNNNNENIENKEKKQSSKNNNSKDEFYKSILGITNKQRKEYEKENERKAKEKNDRLAILLMGEKKRTFEINNNEEIKKENNNNNNNNLILENKFESNIHIKEKIIIISNNNNNNYLFKPSNKRNYDNYYKYTKNEIFENVLDFEFYKKKLPTEIVPNNFENKMHYKFIWIRNFYNELKFLLLKEKTEKKEIKNYIECDVRVQFIFFKNSENLHFFKINTNKKLTELNRKIFKDNDIIAFCHQNIPINPDEISFLNNNNRFYFIGIIFQENNDLLVLVHSKYVEKFHLIPKANDYIENPSSKYYKTYYLGNLTSPLREYMAILNLELSSFNGILDKKYLLNNMEKPMNLSSEARAFIDNIKIKNKFNPSQIEAIEKVSKMKEKDIMLIQGPPGTGKTHTILGLISLFLLNNNGKILICAPSNAAIDEICARIATKGILNSDLTESNVKFLRFGLYDRYERENKFLKTQNGKILENYSLEYLSDQKYKSETENILSLLEKCNKKINLLNEKYNKIINISEKKSINFQLNELNLQKNSLLRNLSEKRSQKKKFEFDILTQSKIVCTTLNSSGSERLKNLLINFDYLIIDEACQCVEPSNLIPLSHKIKKLIMVGDHMQLPATVFSPNASKILYNRSLFERFLDNNYPRHILTIQYRMHSNIRNFIGQTFYENKLVDNEEYIKKLKENKIYQSINEKYNFCFFDISYGEEKIDMKSFNNIFEIDFIIKLILKIAKKINLEFDENNELDYFEIKKKSIEIYKKNYKFAIITPYKSQVKLITEKIKELKKEKNIIKSTEIEINTIDSFQGQERDIIIFSTVRSNFTEDTCDEENNSNNDDIYVNCIDKKIPSTGTGIGFLNDFRRMNVGLSRAKYACFVVGNGDTLKNNEYWNKFITYCKEKNNYFLVDKEKNSYNNINEIFVKNK